MKTVIEMAREAGLVGGPVYARGLEKFAELVRADALAQRTWVGLTTDELKEVADRYQLNPPNIPVAFRTIEAKLKEKNT